ncbi:unannotated protein [freshwater metagenome]|uniref:histidinol-phosphate transaminase n=1 Tax=freshwater metagenome TaxID=449393 RepID=A0A6J7I9U1_9ZZZZ|nr:aminotransferase class I/II-fold pyridoxal phosphate-dependent enzyme [Actinomycetota bacterium]
MGLRDRYRRYEALTPQELSAQLRDEADTRRRTALDTVPPLDLRSTTWHEVPPSVVVDAVTFAARAGLHRYPHSDAPDLRNAIARMHDLRAERIAVGEGASQLLGAAARELLSPGDELLTPWPSYPLYPTLARRCGATVVPVPGFDPAALLAGVTDRTRLLLLCNPNDPTGDFLRAGELSALLDALPERVVVLLDEALRDFVDAEDADAALRLVDQHPRMLVFRTFSKAWGLAGLRCGYVVGGPQSEPLLEQLSPPLGVGELTQAGILEALRQGRGLVARRAAQVTVERERLREALRGLPVEVTPSQAHVVWLAAPALDGAQLAGRLAQSKVLVLPGGPLGDPRHVRATLQDADATDRLVRALAEAVGA